MYRQGHDYGSCVRMFCNVGDINAATKISLSSNDPQACYAMARYFEGEGNLSDAILYYSKSGRLTHAIRLAKENNFDQQVMTMSMMSSKQIMIQSAQYFEQKGKFDKCVQLYSRGGNKRRAMDIALAHNLGHLIEDVASGVGDGDDPEVLQSSVSFLMQNQ
jgi:intraflagellar transport protein 140